MNMTTFMLFRTVILSSEIISCKSRLLSWCKCAKSLSMIVKSLPFIEITFVSFGRFAGMCCRFAWSHDILSSVCDWTIIEGSQIGLDDKIKTVLKALTLHEQISWQVPHLPSEVAFILSWCSSSWNQLSIKVLPDRESNPGRLGESQES